MPELTAPERLERTLAIVPWVSSQPGGWATWDEIRDRFDLSVDEAQACLNVASMVGVHPYTPDLLIEVLIDSEGVSIRLPEWFRRPLRPTPEQTFALLTTAKALTAIGGSSGPSPLQRALSKVLSVLDDGAAPVAVDLDDVPDETLATLRAAIAAGHVVEAEYFSYGRDEIGRRRIDPWRVQQSSGHWYLQGRCHVRDDERLFRLDRMVSVIDTGETFAPPTELPPFRVFDGADTDASVRLRLRPSATWVLEYYPAEAVERFDDGSAEVLLSIGEVRWLERLLLRLGPDAQVVDASLGLIDVERAAARRLLDRYRQ